MVQYTQHWLSHASNWGITMHGAWRVLRSFIVHYRLVPWRVGSYMHSREQNVLQTSCTKSWKLHAPQCICMKSGKLLVHFDGLHLNRRLPCGIPCPSPKPAVDRTYNVACCYDQCFLLLSTLPYGNWCFFISYVFCCLTKWSQGCQFCESVS